MKRSSILAALLIIVLAGVATVASSYRPSKCVHEFVRSEDSVIKIQKYEFDGYYPVGRKNGPMLICIKCYYKTPQILDYGDVNKDISTNKKK